jgi:hypothetical protein
MGSKFSLKNGNGELSYKDGSIAKGMFKNGKLYGQGTITYINGTIEEGMFKNGLLNGKGNITYKNGTIEEGMFKNGKPIFYVNITYMSGSTYKGTVLYTFNLRYLTNGVYRYKDGSCVKGGFNRGQLSNKGVLSYYHGIILEGVVGNDKLNGLGRVVKNGNKYTGEFKNGNFHGKGIYTTHNDTIVYEGGFMHDRFHGQGVIMCKGSISEKGKYENGKLVCGIVYLWSDDGTCVKFDVHGNVINDVILHQLEDKVKILTDMVHDLQK